MNISGEFCVSKYLNDIQAVIQIVVNHFYWPNFNNFNVFV